jgi:glycerol-3-phosphate dehydrogenase (NAD(P)+)
MKVSVIGSGKFGMTLMKLYAIRYGRVSWWVYPDPAFGGTDLLRCLSQERRHPAFFQDISIPPSVSISSDLEEVVHGSTYVVSAVPSDHLKPMLLRLKDIPFEWFVNASKGVIDDQPICETAKILLPKKRYASISGPTIASQLMDNFSSRPGGPAAATIAAAVENAEAHTLEEHLAFYPFFRLSHHPDVRGVEYCGILKQIYAMALGATRGLGNQYDGNSSISLFLACGREIKTILGYMGCNPRTYDDTYAGAPDLYVTFQFGRNGKAGELIAKHGVDEARSLLQGECVEGFRVLASMYRSTRGSGLGLPILRQLYKVVYEDRDVSQAVHYILHMHEGLGRKR